MADGLPQIPNADVSDRVRRDLQPITEHLPLIEGDIRAERERLLYLTTAETDRPMSLVHPTLSSERA